MRNILDIITTLETKDMVTFPTTNREIYYFEIYVRFKSLFPNFLNSFIKNYILAYAHALHRKIN